MFYSLQKQRKISEERSFVTKMWPDVYTSQQ